MNAASGRVYLTKRSEIATSHRCVNPHWNRERTRSVYGDETRHHGHNYLVEATLSGTVDPHTGMVVNIKDVKAALKQVLADYDHRDMNGDVPAFSDFAPTTERLARAMFDALTATLSAGRLERLRLFETEDTLYETFHEVSPLRQPPTGGAMLITRRYTFSAAHRLHSPHLSEADNATLFRDCNNPNGHGHNYTLEVTVKGDVNADSGLAANHQSLDETIKKAVVDRYHYCHLNDDLPEFADQVTTSENIVKIIWSTLAERLGNDALYRVKLGETRDNYFEYFG